MSLCVGVTACFDNESNTHFTQEKSVYKQNKRYSLTMMYLSGVHCLKTFSEQTIQPNWHFVKNMITAWNGCFHFSFFFHFASSFLHETRMEVLSNTVFLLISHTLFNTPISLNCCFSTVHR